MDDYIGQIKVGYAADFIGFNLNKLEFAGGLSDPTSAVIFCDAKSVDLSVINGDIRIKDGELIERDIEYIVKKHNEISKKILEKL
jgi:cytosine/adenosine deaminase-related metal-dependent hydrolase